MMRLVAAGPVLAGLGAPLGCGCCGGSAPSSRPAAVAFLDIGARDVVPGANDNLTAVAVVLELARAASRSEPVHGVRVLLVSTGSEESFMEGMRGFVARHRSELAPERTRVILPGVARARRSWCCSRARG